MLRVKFKKYYKGNRKGDIISVTNNEAIGLVEIGAADVTNASITSSNNYFYEDKMMVSEQIKTYKIK